MTRKILKVTRIIFIILLFVFVYEVAGILVAYSRHPAVSAETKQNTAAQKYEKHAAGDGERAAIIEENAQALLQRVRLITNAQESLVLSTFAFHSDESGRIIIGALLDAAERGVQVRILADGFESYVAMEGNPYFYALSSHDNIEVKLYNKANPLKPWKMMGRMHDKYLIADEQVYLLGGRNTYNFFLGDFPGHKNYDRDVLVYCENPQKENSVSQLGDYFDTIWAHDASRYFHEKKALGKRSSVKNAAETAAVCYNTYIAENQAVVCDKDYEKDTAAAESIVLLSNPIHTQAKEPVVWYQLGELMKQAKQRVVIHTPYIICNDMMYGTWREVAERVPEFTVMTNSAANNGNPFGSADYAKNRAKILDTGVSVWEYEGGYSYHGKSILIDEDLSVIGSFNMDMRSAYLDTELMLVIRSEEVNERLERNMQAYERVSRLVQADGTYANPYGVKPIELTRMQAGKIFLIQTFLGWVRFLF